MCTGNFWEDASASGNNKPRPPVGTKCAEACVFERGRWGSSFCNTEDGNWGAECVPCTSKLKGSTTIHFCIYLQLIF